jgi:hypothetical protein
MKQTLKLFGIVSSLLCFISGIRTFFIFEGSVPSATLDFYHSAGIFFIAVGLFIGPVLWSLSNLTSKK